MAKIKLTKLGILRDEISTAIFLYFKRCNWPSIHLLISAAHEISDTLCREAGHKSVSGQIEENIADKKIRSKMFKLLRGSYAFLKHTSSNMDLCCDLETSHPETLIHVTIYKYHLLAGGRLPLDMALFRMWFAKKNPKLAVQCDSRLAEYIPVIQAYNWGEHNKAEFYDGCMRLAQVNDPSLLNAFSDYKARGKEDVTPSV